MEEKLNFNGVIYEEMLKSCLYEGNQKLMAVIPIIRIIRWKEKKLFDRSLELLFRHPISNIFIHQATSNIIK